MEGSRRGLNLSLPALPGMSIILFDVMHNYDLNIQIFILMEELQSAARSKAVDQSNFI